MNLKTAKALRLTIPERLIALVRSRTRFTARGIGREADIEPVAEKDDVVALDDQWQATDRYKVG